MKYLLWSNLTPTIYKKIFYYFNYNEKDLPLPYHYRQHLILNSGEGIYLFLIFYHIHRGFCQILSTLFTNWLYYSHLNFNFNANLGNPRSQWGFSDCYPLTVALLKWPLSGIFYLQVTISKSDKINRQHEETRMRGGGSREIAQW